MAKVISITERFRLKARNSRTVKTLRTAILAATGTARKSPLSACAHIANARVSSSLLNTGIEHPDISTRLTASRAASGDAP
jgi:hypothetical protein